LGFHTRAFTHGPARPRLPRSRLSDPLVTAPCAALSRLVPTMIQTHLSLALRHLYQKLGMATLDTVEQHKPASSRSVAFGATQLRLPTILQGQNSGPRSRLHLWHQKRQAVITTRKHIGFDEKEREMAPGPFQCHLDGFAIRAGRRGPS